MAFQVIGENIHVLSTRVKTAFAERDKEFIQDLIEKEVQGGATMLDLNIGPAKKTGVDTMSWLVDVAQEVSDLPLSLDTTNADAIEAGLQKVNKTALINSTSADPERIAVAMPLAAKYNANIIALALGTTGLPGSADARVQLVMDYILPAAEQYGISPDRIYLDPLVLTVSGTQDQTAQVVDAIRIFKSLTDPAPMTTCGLSNCSNQAPAEIRPIINRTFLVMCMGAGIDSAIMDALDPKIMATVRCIESGVAKDSEQQVMLKLYERVQNMEDLQPEDVDMKDPEQLAIWKTVQILTNKIIYAHNYLNI
jgi:5-methyltetrahydrofolate corrinoid/iron sulfur protein methyltransferase